MKFIATLLLLFSTMAMSSCETTDSNFGLAGDITIGSNFGFCFGPCYQAMTLNKATNEVFFEVKYRNGVDLKSEVFKDDINDASLASIIKALDTDLINELDETYGCPDCADGGSEWIELNANSESAEVKRVTFEYGKAPKEIENLVNLLRRKKEELSTKYVQAK